MESSSRLALFISGRQPRDLHPVLQEGVAGGPGGDVEQDRGDAECPQVAWRRPHAPREGLQREGSSRDWRHITDQVEVLDY